MDSTSSNNKQSSTKMDSKATDDGTDEVDFAPTTKKEICVSCKSYNPLKKGFLMRNSNSNLNNNNNSSPTKKTSLYGDCELQTSVKSHISALEKLQLFQFSLRSKKSFSGGSEPLIEHEKSSQSTSSTTKENRPRLIKSSSIARLFGNTYSTKKSEESHHTVATLKKSASVSEKFSNRANESDEEFIYRMSEQSLSLSESASNLNSLDASIVSLEKPSHKTTTIRTLTRGLGKLLRRSSDRVEISTPDPEYKVFYLGNVLTGWAKGESSSRLLNLSKKTTFPH